MIYNDAIHSTWYSERFLLTETYLPNTLPTLSYTMFYFSKEKHFIRQVKWNILDIDDFGKYSQNPEARNIFNQLVTLRPMPKFRVAKNPMHPLIGWCTFKLHNTKQFYSYLL